MRVKNIYILILIFITMEFNAQELQSIFGKEIKSLKINAQGKDYENNFPLTFFDKEVKNENIAITNGKITSIVFYVDAKENLDLLKQIIRKYQSPQLALDSNLFPESNTNEAEGKFGFGKISSKDFVFEEAKLDSYYYLVWNTQDFMINYYKPNTDMNDSSNVKVEIVRNN